MKLRQGDELKQQKGGQSTDERLSIKITPALKSAIRAEKTRRQDAGDKGVTEGDLMAKAWEIAMANNLRDIPTKDLRSNFDVTVAPRPDGVYSSGNDAATAPAVVAEGLREVNEKLAEFGEIIKRIADGQRAVPKRVGSTTRGAGKARRR